MISIGWRFPPLSGGTRQGYTNNDIEGFKGEELIDNLAREICQNSLDAKRTDYVGPVKVIFELKHVPTDKYEAISTYPKSIAGCKKYWGSNMDTKLERFIKDAEEMLAQESIPILVAGDYYTYGLNGSKTKAMDSAWEALTGSDGVSVKNTETSGGSFGIGKNAPFACSALSMVFYNTFASDGEKAFVGVARLATLIDEAGKDTQRVGRYQKNDNENENWVPIFDDDYDSFRDLFARDKNGTDVIIVGFNQESGWVDAVSKAVLKNFFVAISENKLVVELRNGADAQRIIDATTISQIIADYSEDREMAITSQLYKAFTNPDKKTHLTILTESDVEVYIKSESSFSRTIANFRDTGMLIGIKSRRIFQHYAAILIVRGDELGELLRDTEPPRHNRWDYKNISATDKSKRKKAREAITKIDEDILAILKQQFEVVTEDTVDAAGVGEYIPDELDNLGGAGEGDDILKAKIKIGKVRTAPQKTGTISTEGVKDTGEPESGDVHNHEKNPNPPPHPPRPPKPVHPHPDDDHIGVRPSPGSKTITIPNLSAQRAFPISSSAGLYKIVIKPTESYNNLFVTCSAMGEDGRTDKLDMETFTYNGVSIPIVDKKAGPIKVEADIPAVFFAKFTSKEKMVLSLSITEETKK